MKRASNLMYVGFEDEHDADITRRYEELLEIEALKKSKNIELPKIKSKWKHTNGLKYKVICITNLESINPKYEKQVVYKGKNGNIWSRPLSDWYRSFTEI